MIAWFTTSGVNVAIIQCYCINGLRNTLRPHPITSHCHLSSSMILWSRTQEKDFIKEMGGMWRHDHCDQRGNKMCLFLPKKCPVSCGNHLHSTLYLVVSCPSKSYLSLPLEFLALLGFLPAYIWWPREHNEIQVDISWSGSHAKFVCFLMHVTGPQVFFFFFFSSFNRTLSRLPVFLDLWQSGFCFLSPRCTFSWCLFSINFQMWLHTRLFPAHCILSWTSA